MLKILEEYAGKSLEIILAEFGLFAVDWLLHLAVFLMTLVVYRKVFGDCVFISTNPKNPKSRERK